MRLSPVLSYLAYLLVDYADQTFIFRSSEEVDSFIQAKNRICFSRNGFVCWEEAAGWLLCLNLLLWLTFSMSSIMHGWVLRTLSSTPWSCLWGWLNLLSASSISQKISGVHHGSQVKKKCSWGISENQLWLWDLLWLWKLVPQISRVGWGWWVCCFCSIAVTLLPFFITSNCCYFLHHSLLLLEQQQSPWFGLGCWLLAGN